jgi:hypothetical protein
VWVLVGIVGILLVTLGVAMFEPADVRAAGRVGPRTPGPPRGAVRGAASLLGKLFRRR